VDIYLGTQRLLLRQFTADDLDDVHALDSDPEVMRFITGGPATPREVLRDEHLPHWMAFYERGDDWGFWAAQDRTTGAFLGWFHLRPGTDARSDEPELGYRLRRDVWGLGLATEGSLALIDRAFTRSQATRVYATTMAINVASRRVMEKAGMHFVRLFRGDWPQAIPGDEHGDVEYAITREQWRADRSPDTDPGTGPSTVTAQRAIDIEERPRDHP